MSERQAEVLFSGAYAPFVRPADEVDIVVVAGRERSVGHTPWKLIVEARAALRAATDLSMIPARDLDLLKRRASGATFQEMADEMGLSHDRVKQLYPEALKRLRHTIRDTPAAVHIFERFG